MERACQRCGRVRPHHAKGYCKSCYNWMIRQRDSDAVKQYGKAWRKAHPYYFAQYMRAYRALS